MRTKALCVAVSAFAACSTASARDALFNFESNSASANTYGPFVGGYAYLSDSSGGVNLTLNRSSGATFDVMSTSGQFSPFLFPAQWGTQALAPFANFGTNDSFNANFSGATVTGVSIEYGDFGADSGSVAFEVWSGADGSGSLLFSTSVFYSGNINSDGPATFSYSGTAAIGSFRFKGEGTSFPQSLYWDNIGAVTGAGIIPLPTAAGLGLAGLSAIGLRRRR